MTLFYLFTIAFLGLCLGSFATALTYRLPRGISMISKVHSSCPACGHDLGLRDLVPLLSWLMLKGQCRYCGGGIGARYPLIELATLALCLGFYFVYGFTPQGFALFALAPVLVSIAAIDLRHKIIPDGLNLSVLLLGAAALASSRPGLDECFSALAGAVFYAGGAAALRLVFLKIKKREPMGLGDVKFFGAAGLWLGPDPEAAAQFMLASGVAGIVLGTAWRRVLGEEEFPFGPALVLALSLLLFLQRPFLDGAF